MQKKTYFIEYRISSLLIQKKYCFIAVYILKRSVHRRAHERRHSTTF